MITQVNVREMNRKEGRARFGELWQGDFFIWNSELFMNMGDGNAGISIRGDVRKFDLDTLVTPMRRVDIGYEAKREEL